MTEKRSYWWQRADLAYANNRLHLAGHSLEHHIRPEITPTYFYSAPRIRENLNRLVSTLQQCGIDARIFYAMKANHYQPLLELLQQTKQCGIDTCSPEEVKLALKVGYQEEDISYTGTALSEMDLNALSEHPGLIMNLDSISAIRRWGKKFPGSKIGIRINPQIGLGYRDNPYLQYAGEEETKFGIYFNQLNEAIATAKQYNLTINGLHCHAGCGFLTLERLPQVLASIDLYLKQLPPLAYINLGGGLGIPLVSDDKPLDLETWAGKIRNFAQKHSTQLYFEPGDYIVKDSGVLATTVTLIEKKRNTTFVGLNAGFNTHIEPAFYNLPLEPVPLYEPSADPASWPTVTLSGNINEALDIFARSIKLPPVAEGDILCLLNAGGYGASMASNHCLRPLPGEQLLDMKTKA